MNKKNNIEGFRKCSCCKTEKLINSNNFCSDKNRYLGFSYRCKECDRAKKDNRKERYKNLTNQQKEVYKAKNRKYTSSGLGRATALICSYRKADLKKGQLCDLDRLFLVNEIFSSKCVYCGETENLGCDRLDNKIGHVKTNVVPCCKLCNTTRMDNFTHDEMLLIGGAIKKIKEQRVLTGCTFN